MTGVGGGESWPPLFFQLWGYQKPQSALGTFLVLKSTRKAILDNFRFLRLATRGLKKSIDIIVKNSKFQKF